MEVKVKQNRSRVGFHYFPDTEHYTTADLEKWLPELLEMGVSWLVLKAPKERAIPEDFITSLTRNGIEPILQFDLQLAEPPNPLELSSLLAAYANWGVHAVQFFDRPNSRGSWKASQWALLDIVEQFLDRFIPYASLALKHGLVPIFPPPEPGGNYWDTAFLRSALEVLARRNQDLILQSMIISAYAWTGGHCLNWGEGGPDRWPLSKPYSNDPDSQDQRGFRVFDWYNAITKAVAGRVYPMILFQSGSDFSGIAEGDRKVTSIKQEHGEAIIRLMHNQPSDDPDHPGEPLQPLPANIIAACFWLLAANSNESAQRAAWFLDDGTTSPLVEDLRALAPKNSSAVIADNELPHTESEQNNSNPVINSGGDGVQRRPIEHYLLLPIYDWGIAEWHLDVIRPFVKKHRPTVGFSIEEAALAQNVTVIGSHKVISDDALDSLRNAGAKVERISGDGISIATKLAER